MTDLDYADHDALARLWSPDEWCNRVGRTFREREGYEPHPVETGSSGRAGAREADEISGEINASKRRRVPDPERDHESRHRQAAIWMLRQGGASYREIGVAFGVTANHARVLGTSYEHQLERREDRAADWREPWAQRLRAAGAIR